jgi:predicted alpha/beta hydrolase family esterase
MGQIYFGVYRSRWVRITSALTANDPFFSVAQGQRTARALGVPLRMYGQAGHFLPEERPLEIAADLRMLLEDARNVAPRDEARELAGRIV